MPGVACQWQSIYTRLENSCYEYTTLVRIPEISAPSSSEFKWPISNSECTKRLCLEGATRANVPLVYRFHSLIAGLLDVRGVSKISVWMLAIAAKGC